jgi:hypothetical protein
MFFFCHIKNALEKKNSTEEYLQMVQWGEFFERTRDLTIRVALMKLSCYGSIE